MEPYNPFLAPPSDISSHSTVPPSQPSHLGSGDFTASLRNLDYLRYLGGSQVAAAQIAAYTACLQWDEAGLSASYLESSQASTRPAFESSFATHFNGLRDAVDTFRYFAPDFRLLPDDSVADRAMNLVLQRQHEVTAVRAERALTHFVTVAQTYGIAVAGSSDSSAT